MSLVAWLFVYVLGGITFIPLVLIAAFASLLYLSPPVGDSDPSKLTKDKLQVDVTATVEDAEKHTSVLPKALQGWIIVRRTFEEPPQDNASYVGNLMRSYLASKQSTATSSTSNLRRPRDTFYAVLKGTVLYLYEDEACSDVWAALQVSAYDVDIVGPETRQMTDGELFAKRNSIRLRAKNDASGGVNVVSKDTKSEAGNGGDFKDSNFLAHADEHYIFVKANIQMEDWYISLVHASTCLTSSSATSSLDPLASLEPIYSPHDMAHLVRTLDQQPDPIPMRWLNALIGRLFFALYRTSGLEANLIGRLMKKIAKVPRPAFLSDLSVREVNVGNTAPLLSKPMLKELTREGDASVEMGLTYKAREGEHSGVRITVEATVTIDLKESLPLNLGTRFDLKPRTVKLVLAVVLRSLEGNLLVRIKRPPSNRIWYGFTSMPKMEIELLPIVSDRKIKWGLVLKPIENLLREVIQDSVVLPNMDDIPFFDTEKYEHRGGIFNDAVRAVYEMTSAAATADPSTSVVSEDGTGPKITTVSPSTDIPTTGQMDIRKDDTPTDDDSSSLPGDLLHAMERTGTVVSQPELHSGGAPVSRTGTAASLPASLSPPSKRMSWLPRRFVKGGDAQSINSTASGASDASTLRDSAITEEASSSGVSEPPMPVDIPAEPQGQEELVSVTPNRDSAMPDPPIEVAQVPGKDEMADNKDHTFSLDHGLKLPPPPSEIDSELAVSIPSSPPSLPSRNRAQTVGHQSTQSATGDFFSGLAPRTPANGSSHPSFSATSLSPQQKAAGSTENTPPIALSGNGDMQRSMSSQEPPSSPTPPPTATQALFAAWKNRSTDKQVLANTARDVARDTMKKWGFGMKKDPVAETPAQENMRSPSMERTGTGVSPRPSTPDGVVKTYEQMRMEVAGRHGRRGSMHGPASGSERSRSPQVGREPDDVFRDQSALSVDPEIPRPGVTQGALHASPFRPSSPKATTHIHAPTNAPPSPAQPDRLTPPALQDEPLDLEERARRLSSTSQNSGPPMPVQRQPGQGATMRIPGIHASHRGEVMSMGSTASVPQPAPSATSDTESTAGTPRSVGPKTAATLQSVYRLFKQQTNPTTDIGETPPPTAPGLAPPAVISEPSAVTDPSDSMLAAGRASQDSQARPHERSASGSSASSFLKQIQALDAKRYSAEGDRASTGSRPSSRRASLAPPEITESDGSTFSTPWNDETPVSAPTSVAVD